MNTRRRFITLIPLAGVAALAACGDKAAAPAPAPTPAPAPAPTPAAPAAMLDPADPAAVALGYVSDAKTAKSEKFVAGSACSNCALFAGKSGDAAGPCPLFGGKQVAAIGWCTAYAKKA